MKEKKNWLEEWYLDRTGKIVGAVICLLIFAGGMAIFGMLSYLVTQFGTELLSNPNSGYYGTTYYEDALKQDVSQILKNAKLACWDDRNGRFSIVELGDTALVHEYDTDQVVNAYEQGKIPENMTSINIYEKYKGRESRADSSNFCYYSKAYNLLVTLKNKNAYMCITKGTIINLMEARGYRNTDYKISSRYSEDAIFLFTAVTRVDGDKADDNYEAPTEEYYTYSMVVDGEEKVYRTSEYPELDKVGYLVYEPATQMFSTPWGESFAAEDTYLYRVDDLLSMIAKTGTTVGNTDSILFPMLWTKSCTVQEAFTDAVQPQLAIDQALQTPIMGETGLTYYIKDGDRVCANVDSISEIEKLREHYEIVGGDVQDTGSAYDMATLLKDNKDVAALVEALPKGARIAFGVDAGALDVKSSSAVVRGLAYDTFYQRYGGILEIAMAVCLVLVIIQSVYLVRVAGRRLEDEEGLYLHRTDHIPTEIWLILYGCGGLCAGYIIDTGMDYIGSRQSLEMSTVAGLSAVVWLPFGLVVLLFAMSMSRRIKDRNLWKESCLRCGMEMVQSRTTMKPLNGVERLAFAMICYVLCNVGMFLLYGLYDGENDIMAKLLVLCFLAVQVAAGIGMRRILTDAGQLLEGMEQVKQGELEEAVNIKERTRLFQELAAGVSHISDGLQTAIENSLKDERMKTELITNVSHDLKTPLTSIINYINLLKTQQMPTKEAEHYVDVLEGKAQRLKHLTEDLVEAAKATSGNIELEWMPLAFDELMKQSIGEFEDKYAKRKLTLVAAYPDHPVMILADGRRMFRVLENILQNAYKYSLEGTRVYADLVCENHRATFTLKNVSAAELNISTEELMERFTRGDSARSTEGSGLGLSIARDLTRLQNGTFDIYLDGDLFKVIITFPEYTEITENVQKTHIKNT